MSGFCNNEAIYYDFEQFFFMADQAFRFFICEKAVKRRVSGSRTRTGACKVQTADTRG